MYVYVFSVSVFNLDSTSLNQIARKVAYEALGENKETIREHIKNYPDFDGVVVGDETRLRQIITNLARYISGYFSRWKLLTVVFRSNACKFTPSGGKLIIKTRLVLPNVPDFTDPLDIETAKIPRIEKPDIHENNDIDDDDRSPYHATSHQSRDFAHDDNSVHGPAFEEDNDRVMQPLSTDHLTEHNMQHATSPLEYIIVRIEVTDTGCGIKREDMVQSKLFCKYSDWMLVEHF